MFPTAVRGCTRSSGIRTKAFPALGSSPCLYKKHWFQGPNRQRKFGKLLFRSYSSPPKKEPRLSTRNRIDLLVLAAGACGAAGYLLIHGNNDWDEEVRQIQNKLIISSINSHQRQQSEERILLANEGSSSNLTPPIVRRYIERVLEPPIPPLQPSYSIREQDGHVKSAGESNTGGSRHQCPRPPSIVTAHQSGEFYASRQWYPFEATLMAAVSSKNPGFVWDAQTTIFNLSNCVLQYYITHGNNNNNNNKDGRNGDSRNTGNEGSVVTKVWGKYPLIQIEEEDPYVLFWLAMTPLFPTVLLSSEQGILKWNDTDNMLTATAGRRKNGEATASGELVCDFDGARTRFFAELFFREENALLQRIEVTSNQPDEEQPWQAVYDDYKHQAVETNGQDEKHNEDRFGKNRHQEQRFILIPSKIEIGNGKGDQYRPRLKINNHHVDYK